MTRNLRSIIVGAACAVITSTFAAIASYQCPEGNCTDRAPVASTFTAAKATAKKLLTSQLQIAQMVRDEAVVQGVDPDAAVKIAYLETRFRNVCGPKTRHGKACGVLQVIPKSAERLEPGSARYLNNPVVGIRVGIKHMRDCMNRGAATFDQLAACHVGGKPYAVNAYAKWYVATARSSPVVPDARGWLARGQGSLNVASLEAATIWR